MSPRALSRSPLPFRLALLPFLITTAFAGSAQAQAQAADAPPAPAEQARQVQTLETVIVTGNRRREPVREVPLSVGTVSSEELERTGARHLTDYLENLAGVNVDSGVGGRGLQQVTMRGITVGGDINPPTSTYLDDVAFGGSTQWGAKLSLDLAMLDLNHIEVYRGPQGTLYGANALGGVLKYVFNEPDSTAFEGAASVGTSHTRGGGTNWQLSGVVNVPLQANVAALRVAAVTDRDAGYVNAIGPGAGERVDRAETSGLRVSALLTPMKRLNIRLSAMAQELKRNGADYSDYTLDGKPVTVENEHLRYLAEPFRQRTEVYAADVEYDAGWARFNLVASHQSSRNGYTTDLSPTNVGPLSALYPDLQTVWSQTQVDTRKNTLELRATSPSSKQFEWLAGVYFTREVDSVAQAALGGMSTGDPATLLALAAPATYEEGAVFGDITWYANEKLSFTVGGRASHNRQTFSQAIHGDLQNEEAPESRSSDSSYTYLLTAKYALTPKSNVYARLSTGYNPGGVNTFRLSPSGASLTEHPTYKPNTLTSTEIGYKADLLDGRASVEAALYHLDWKDLQLAHAAAAGNEVVNGGRAQVDGLEFNATFKPVERWSLTPSLAYTNARLRDDVPDLQAKAGDRLPSTPRVSVSLRSQYAFELAQHAGHVGLAVRHVTKRHASYPEAVSVPDYILPAYTIVNANAGIEWGKVTLEAYVRNLFDKSAQRSAATGYAPLGGPVHVSLDQPRTVGVTARVAF
jgi:outer membrane receptor protein involved in Fe transport